MKNMREVRAIASLKKLSKVNEVKELSAKLEAVSESTVTREPEYNEAEDEVEVSKAKLNRTVDVIQNTFDLSSGNFVVTGFSDKGTKCQLSLSNEDFNLTVLIKDTFKHGIM